jgi:hypothetical protein
MICTTESEIGREQEGSSGLAGQEAQFTGNKDNNNSILEVKVALAVQVDQILIRYLVRMAVMAVEVEGRTVVELTTCVNNSSNSNEAMLETRTLPQVLQQHQQQRQQRVVQLLLDGHLQLGFRTCTDGA